MTAIKSFTSLEQSKKLAEILSLKSADIHYERAYFEGKQSDWFVKLGSPIKSDDIIPCWSLAALISIIPQELFDGEYIINITEGVNHKWVISYEAFCGVSSYAVNTSGDNLIDCCVEMIIKLKERNLL